MRTASRARAIAADRFSRLVSDARRRRPATAAQRGRRRLPRRCRRAGTQGAAEAGRAAGRPAPQPALAQAGRSARRVVLGS